MTQQTHHERSLLPEGAVAFLRRRGLEAAGLVLSVTGALLALALFSYNPLDPSWNNATSASPRNLVGMPGAHVADLLFQTLGLAGALVPALLLAWSWRLFSHRGLPRVWRNLTMVPFALLLAAGFASGLPRFGGWALELGLGGWLGDVIAHTVAAQALRIVPAVPAGAWTTLLGVLAGAALVLSLGLGTSEWRSLGGGVLGLGRAVLRAVGGAGLWLRRLDGASDPAHAEPRFGRRAEQVPAARPASIRPPRREDAPSRVSRKATILRKSRRAKSEAQPALDLGHDRGFQLPQLSLLKAPPARQRAVMLDEMALEQNARLLETVLGEFGVNGEIAEVNPGPVVTRYELDPAPGTKTARVIGLADDIARSMSAVSARIAVIPGQNRIGIELPNAGREVVFLRDLLSTPEYENTSARLSLALGKNIAGEPVIADLARMPHLLIAGTTGSGKSVAVNTMILSLLYRLMPEQCRLILIDPKMLELSAYDGIPHLLAPVVTEPGKAVVALKWTVREMQNRYRAMSRLGVRNIAGYNQRVADAIESGEAPMRTVQTGYDSRTGEPVYEDQELDLNAMPFIVVVVDEMADLMMVSGKDVEAAIQRLSQMARAAGIHLIMATQRPSVDVITGTIKANFPTRISFQVTSKIDSRTILGEQGAEQLLGQGDLLLMETGGRIQRVHGPFVSEQEVERVVRALKRQGMPEYLEEVTEEPESGYDAAAGGESEGDELYRESVELVCREQRASTSFVQRHLQVGYNRAARMIERMEAEGIVSAPDRVGKREVLAGAG